MALVLSRRFLHLPLWLAAALLTPLAAAQEWTPPAEVEQAAQAVLERFRRSLDAEDFDAAYAQLAAGEGRKPTPAQWAAQHRAFRARAGAPKMLVLNKVLWRENAADSPRPGVVLFAEYVGSAEKLPSFLEIVLLRQVPGGDFRVTLHRRSDLFALERSPSPTYPPPRREWLMSERRDAGR